MSEPKTQSAVVSSDIVGRPRQLITQEATMCCGARLLIECDGTYRCPCGKRQENLAKRTIMERTLGSPNELCRMAGRKGLKMQTRTKSPRHVGSSAWLGATVRLRKGNRTAIVVSDNVTIGNDRVDGGVRLDKPLGGFRYWNIEDLAMVAPNDKLSHAAGDRDVTSGKV